MQMHLTLAPDWPLVPNVRADKSGGSGSSAAAAAAERFHALREAYQVLSDPSRRAAYDKGLVAQLDMEVGAARGSCRVTQCGSSMGKPGSHQCKQPPASPVRERSLTFASTLLFRRSQEYLQRFSELVLTVQGFCLPLHRTGMRRGDGVQQPPAQLRAAPLPQPQRQRRGCHQQHHGHVHAQQQMHCAPRWGGMLPRA